MNHTTELHLIGGVNETRLTFRHPSGLTVHLIPKQFAATYAVLGVAFGSMDTSLPDGTPLPDGTAHFLEHKMFDLPGGIDALDLFSAEGANANAFTTNEYTAYTFLSTDRFSQNLKNLFRFVLTPYFTKKSVNKELGIIAQEILSYQDDPIAAGYLRILQNIYPHHPIRRDICGTKDSISVITPDLLKKVYEAYYTPSNMTLTVAGNITQEELSDILNSLLPQSALPAPKRVLPGRDIPAYACDTAFCMDISRPRLTLAWRDDVPESNRRRHGYCMEIACTLLFSKSGELYNRLFDAGLAGREFDGNYEWSWGCGHLLVSAESDHPSQTAELLRAYLSDVWQHPPAVSDFIRARNLLYADTLCVFDSSDDIALADLEECICGDDFYEIPSLISSITYEDFCQAITRVFYNNSSILVKIYPEERNATHY